MTKDIERFERALNASMVVAIGKTILFAKYWDYLRARLHVKDKQTIENARVAIREQFNSLNDGLFFMPPEFATSEERVRKYFERRFADYTFKKEFDKEIATKIRLTSPSLADFFTKDS
jgi:lipoate-protein ligase A